MCATDRKLADKQSHRAAVLSELTDLKEETKGHGTLTMAAVIYTSGRRGAVFLSIRGADRESCFCQADDRVQFRASSCCAAEEIFPT